MDHEERLDLTVESLNGHGGNISALNAIIDQLAVDLPGADVSVATYVAIAPARVGEILETQGGIMHACEGETSMMLAAFPQLVAEQLLPQAVGPESGLRSDAVPLYRWRSFRDVTENGVSGDARSATADKGEELLNMFAETLAQQILITEPHSGPASGSEKEKLA